MGGCPLNLNNHCTPHFYNLYKIVTEFISTTNNILAQQHLSHSNSWFSTSCSNFRSIKIEFHDALCLSADPRF